MRRVVSKIVFAMDTKKHHLIPDSPSRTCFPGIIFKVMSISQKSSLRAEQFQPDIQHDPFPKAKGNCTFIPTEKIKRCLQKQKDSLGAVVILRFNYLSPELQVSMLQR